jgi:hypothetical protein
MNEILCTKTMATHWCVLFEAGKYYKYSIYEKEVSVITNYKKWNETISEITRIGFEIIKMKNKGIDSTWLVNKNKILNTQKNKYVKNLSLPHFVINSDDKDTPYYFLTSTDEELYQLGTDKANNDKPMFTNSTNRINENFDYTSIVRDNRIDNILNNKEKI